MDECASTAGTSEMKKDLASPCRIQNVVNCELQ